MKKNKEERRQERVRESPALSSSGPAVRVEGISKYFGSFEALKDISFEIRSGEVLGFLGPNGAGKTTTMRILAGYFPPTSGTVWIEGEELYKNPQKVKRQIGYLPETLSLYPGMRVEEFLSFVAGLRGVSRGKMKTELNEKMGLCGLSEVRKRMIGNLSKGFRQRVGLAQALVGDPRVLILDEPTSGLDPKQIIEIRSLIRELGRKRTIILSTHILPEVNMICDRVLIVSAGRVVASGTTDQLEKDLSQKNEIFVSIGDRRFKKEAVALLESLSAVEHVKVLEETEEVVNISLSAKKGTDLRPIISRMFVEHQIPLLEIRSGRLSLEEIFMKLVVSETPEKPLS